MLVEMSGVSHWQLQKYNRILYIAQIFVRQSALYSESNLNGTVSAIIKFELKTDENVAFGSQASK